MLMYVLLMSLAEAVSGVYARHILTEEVVVVLVVVMVVLVDMD